MKGGSYSSSAVNPEDIVPEFAVVEGVMKKEPMKEDKAVIPKSVGNDIFK